MRTFAIWLLLCVGAAAQGCGAANPNCIVPTAPPGTNDNRAASTAFLQAIFNQQHFWSVPQGFGAAPNPQAMVLIQGASSTAADYAFFVQNSSATLLIALRDDGTIFLAGPNLGTLFSAASHPLPACTAGSGLTGARATVTDATGATYGGAYVSGGTQVRNVICVVGTGWVHA